MLDVHVVGSPESAFYVNAFVLEGKRSIVVIDTHFLNSSAAALKARVAELDKPVAAVVITHPHPDHFNGTRLLLDGTDVPVFATLATRSTIEATAPGKLATWKPKYGDDYPDAVLLPNQLLEPGEILRIDDIELALHELGPGESADAAVVHLPQANALIASDLIYARCHPWLAEGRTGAWLDQLAAVQARFGDVPTVYAGHGPTGGPELFDEQREYLDHFRYGVRSALASSDQAAALRAFGEAIRARHSGWPLEFLVELNLDGVARELAGAEPAQLPNASAQSGQPTVDSK